MHANVHLTQAQTEAVDRAKVMLQPPPILPQRTANGEVIEVDEKLAGATTHRMIFTETSQHKDNQVYSLILMCCTVVNSCAAVHIGLCSFVL